MHKKQFRKRNQSGKKETLVRVDNASVQRGFRLRRPVKEKKKKGQGWQLNTSFGDGIEWRSRAELFDSGGADSLIGAFQAKGLSGGGYGRREVECYTNGFTTCGYRAGQ